MTRCLFLVLFQTHGNQVSLPPLYHAVLVEVTYRLHHLKSNGQFLFLILAHLSAALGTVDPFLLETFSSSGFWDNTFS